MEEKEDWSKLRITDLYYLFIHPVVHCFDRLTDCVNLFAQQWLVYAYLFEPACIILLV